MTAYAQESLEDSAPLYVVRESHDGDRPYITKAWVASSTETALARALSANYEREQSALVWAWLPHVTVRVACDSTDPDAILGFVVYQGSETSIVHYVHVRKDFRRLGIARALLGPLVESRAIYTHRITDGTRYAGFKAQKSKAPDADARLFEVPPLWTFNPFPFFRGPR